ncbi:MULTISPECIES: Fe2+-enterobactin ABC transporter substrate-binding protein [Prescottella]|uniref:Fe2+-enterobactin ABC transporter substrate-binding protein n=3 Tax=Rhodococcus hoagii TaxID=43767 RepID=A0AAE5F3F3_RHOHA|nr:Fe2+-enterobactin ABC transporter substrate-binding protein [Prescottella equi]MBU4616358.1 Fe2+-enterobactin ABC transporter substrate-binding protein [Rhodococcus sp. GG48]GBF16893.1 ferrienterobactin-binding periplasmic protein precursor [Rhodococcus sp. Br-6]ERN47765.1 iron-enterobactin transporter periplasmic binding protein [Prescottella equi NBRC 101255 = C 7]MBM4468764.1 Fe2+-enterobactin ABC transporter substrate-binding protein [Prescottella equi]MBM4478129.1 Fe2+-enterobactin ABC
MLSTTLRRRSVGTRIAVTLGALAIGMSTAACSSDGDSADAAAATTTQSGEWPRTVDTATGPVTLDAQPQRIVSTSVTLTGSLLSLDAPLIGTGAQPKSTVTNDQGLFTQWADVAAERDVEVLYQGQPNVEKITAAAPDLIVVSTSGADSAAQQVATLSQIAPTLLFDYSDKSWQDLTTQLAAAVGKEDRATELLAEFDARIDEAKRAIAPALQNGAAPVNILTYNSPDDSKIFTAESAQGRLISRLGLTVGELPAEIAGSGAAAGRSDIVSVNMENLPRALTGATTFVINAQQPGADRLKADPTLAAVPSVQRGAVFPLDFDSFRLDFYSANNVVDRIVAALS